MFRVPACARVSRVSRVCPGSPRCLFTGTIVGPSRDDVSCTGYRPGPGHTPYGRLPMRRLRIRAGATIIAQHKPISFLSPSTDPRGNKRYARDLLMHTNLRGHWPWEGEPRDLPGLSCCGRLDADSSGLLLWTDDHDLAQFIIGPNTPVEKEYLVRVSGQQHYSEATLADSLALLRSGITLDGEPLRAADVSWANTAHVLNRRIACGSFEARSDWQATPREPQHWEMDTTLTRKCCQLAHAKSSSPGTRARGR